jgi:hypothetical protein
MQEVLVHRVVVAVAIIVVGFAPRDAAAEVGDDEPGAYLAIDYGVTVRRIADPATRPSALARGSGPASDTRSTSTAVSFLQRFALALSRHVYVGSEVEVTRDDDEDRSPERPRMASGAQLVAGVMASSHSLKLGAELTGGWRVMYSAPDHAVFEARVHGELWLAPHLTLGVAVGTSIVERGDGVAALYIGLHTREFGE